MTKDIIKIPEDFMIQLKKDDYLYEWFMNFPPSHKREYIKWIEEAKRPQTRSIRIHKTIEQIRAKHQQGRYV